MLRLRKRFRVLLLSAIVVGVIVPVGYALSPDSAMPRSYTQAGLHQTTAAVAVAAPVIAHVPMHASAPATPGAPAPEPPAVPDAAKLLLVGTSLFGLAAAVRKAH
jgi:hypothetical protein